MTHQPMMANQNAINIPQNMQQGGMPNGQADPQNFNHQTQYPPPSSYMRNKMSNIQLQQQQNRNLAPGQRIGSATQQTSGPDVRPMTSNRGAGFQKQEKGKRTNFDPMNLSNKGPAPALVKKTETTPEETQREIEREINRLIELSSKSQVGGKFSDALEKAKEAANKDRQLRKQREQNNMLDQVNMDLTQSVCFNLANVQQANKMQSEALNTYTLIVKNKQQPQAGRLRVNMGNIQFAQKKQPTAIKMYRMALDQIPKTSKDMRFKIMRNIGHSFVKLGQFQDAIESQEIIMEGAPDHETGFNLLLCYQALGDSDKLKRVFVKLVSIDLPGMEEEEEDDDMEEGESNNFEGKKEKSMDRLKEQLREKKRKIVNQIVNAGKLISPFIEVDFIEGQSWVIETVRLAGITQAESELEMAKAAQFLKKKDFDGAIEVFKSFEMKDKQLRGRAATNISFLYFLEQDYRQAEHQAELAIKADRQNAKALVNKGNCCFVKEEQEKSKEHYLEAIGVEADCVEAIYNLGLVNRTLGCHAEAIQAQEKIQSIIWNAPEVMWQIANAYEASEKSRNAIKWYNILITKVTSDPHVLMRLANLNLKIQTKNQDGEMIVEKDETQAFQYFLESFRFQPVILDAISWLGCYYVKNYLYEKACVFFERASQIQPGEVKWRLMVASCYRRMGNFPQALRQYENIIQEHPENIECLRQLIIILKDDGKPQEHQAQQLKKLERKGEESKFDDQNRGEMMGYADNQSSYQNSNVSNPIPKNVPKGGHQKTVEAEDFDDDDTGDLLSM